MTAAAFDNEKYLQTQSEHIRQRIAQFGGKLYLEFGQQAADAPAIKGAGGNGHRHQRR